jgi:hypothetical protein
MAGVINTIGADEVYVDCCDISIPSATRNTWCST